ncbi:hypothetical protein C5167_034189 [Papaver somniferum]|uniref:Uncharacterized protein n=1 Tax=Papaver somniferum TaxID=3469 RepID=A0A4Y7KGA3_PAPSO|nr:hypothetical protein C5167_034189 [Papaver somniferum]
MHQIQLMILMTTQIELQFQFSFLSPLLSDEVKLPQKSVGEISRELGSLGSKMWKTEIMKDQDESRGEYSI